MRLINFLVLFSVLIGSTVILQPFAKTIMQLEERSEDTEVSNIRVNKKDIVISKKTGLRLYHGEPYTGEVVVYHASGKLAKLSNYNLGLRHGYLKQWFPNGVLSFSAEYVEGIPNGITQSWWENGNLRSMSTFVDGKANGESKQRYVTGELFKKMHYENGIEIGLQQAWRQNGKLFTNYEYVNGRIFGLKRSNMCVELKDEKLVKKNNA